jgi:hypothetical protein
MLYKKAASSIYKLKNWKINSMKKGIRHKTFNQLKKGSQFLRSLNTFSLEKNSLNICPGVGLTKFPLESFHP